MRRAGRFLLTVIVIGALVLAGWWFVLRPLQQPDAPAAVAGQPTSPAIPAGAFEMTVESVHDGDTLRAHVSAPNAVVTDLASTRVRLLGIDTPEISPEVDCWGAEATASLTALLPPGSTVWAAADAEVLDQYGRHLLYLWTPDGRFVNGELVAAGDARTEFYDPNRLHEPLLRDLEARAMAEGLGQWGACG